MNEELPPGWAWKTLEDLTIRAPASITDGPFGSNLKSEHYTDSGARVVRLQNIGEGQFLDAEAHISLEHFERLRKHEVEAGDVLVAMLGEVLPRACIAPLSLGLAIVKADCVRVRVDTRMATRAYIMYALNCDQTRRLAATIVHGVGRPRLNLGELKGLRIPIAPLAEQFRIVAAIEQHLSDIDAGVAALERTLLNLKRYRAAVLKAACEGRLVPTEAEIARKEGHEYEPAEVLLQRILKERRARWEAEQLAKMKAKGQSPRDDAWKSKYTEPSEVDLNDLPALPEGWCWASLGQLSDIQGGIQKQPKRAPRENKYPFLRVANVGRGRLDLSEVHEVELFGDELERLRLERGDMLIVEGNGSPTEIGRLALWDGSIPDCVHQNHIIRARLSRCCSPAYVSYAWNSPDGVKRTTDISSSTTGLYTLSVFKVESLPIPVPPALEQLRIVAEVDRLLSVADTTEQATRAQLGCAKRLRQAVLKLAFAGKLVPQIAGEEPVNLLAPSSNTNSQPVKKSPEKANGPAPTMRPRIPKTPEHASAFRPLEDVLAAHASPMTAEALFSEAGYAAEHVDDFYTELRRLELAGKIEEIRSTVRLIRLRKADL